MQIHTFKSLGAVAAHRTASKFGKAQELEQLNRLLSKKGSKTGVTPDEQSQISDILGKISYQPTPVNPKAKDANPLQHTRATKHGWYR
jgi:hypothetical protein